MGALAAIRHRGLKCPDDISVVGFDDIRFARYLDPPLTTISQPTHEIGRRVVKLLLDILSGEAADRRDVTLPHQLVIRGSTAPPPKGPST
jgi:LacI family repressor for deo operon, udp, cdd, tsx, nupC, and nupG